jgi:hypothetical protein
MELSQRRFILELLERSLFAAVLWKTRFQHQLKYSTVARVREQLLLSISPRFFEGLEGIAMRVLVLQSGSALSRLLRRRFALQVRVWAALRSKSGSMACVGRSARSGNAANAAIGDSAACTIDCANASTANPFSTFKTNHFVICQFSFHALPRQAIGWCRRSLHA